MSLAETSFAGRVIVVTGAGRGLGRCYAEFLARRGARVIVNDIGVGPGGPLAEEVVRAITAGGGEAVACVEDVQSGERVIGCALDSYGAVHGLVNNAGILRDAAFHKMHEADWESVFAVHVRGAFRLTHAVWPHLRKQGYGRVVMICSAAAMYGNFGQCNYAAAKMALHGFAMSLAVEGRKHNVLVNSVAPFAYSPMTAAGLPAEFAQRAAPERVTPLVALLCHADCAATGQLFEAGGGRLFRVRWQRSQPAQLGPAEDSIATVRERLALTESFEGSTAPASLAEAVAAFFPD